MEAAEVQVASIPSCSTGATRVPHIAERKSFLAIVTDSRWLASLHDADRDKHRGVDKRRGKKKHRLSILRSFIPSLRKRRFKNSESLLSQVHTRDTTPVSDENDPEPDNHPNNLLLNSPAADPFKTPPRTPTKSVTANDSSPLSIVTNSPDSTSTKRSFERKRRARLMSRLKSIQILGIEAGADVANKWLEEDLRFETDLTLNLGLVA